MTAQPFVILTAGKNLGGYTGSKGLTLRGPPDSSGGASLIICLPNIRYAMTLSLGSNLPVSLACYTYCCSRAVNRSVHASALSPVYSSFSRMAKGILVAEDGSSSLTSSYSGPSRNGIAVDVPGP